MQAAGAVGYGFMVQDGQSTVRVVVAPHTTPFDEFRARFQPLLGDIPLILAQPLEGLDLETASTASGCDSVVETAQRAVYGGTATDETLGKEYVIAAFHYPKEATVNGQPGVPVRQAPVPPAANVVLAEAATLPKSYPEFSMRVSLSDPLPLLDGLLVAKFGGIEPHSRQSRL